jgi:hypothetical protein
MIFHFEDYKWIAVKWLLSSSRQPFLDNSCLAPVIQLSKEGPQASGIDEAFSFSHHNAILIPLRLFENLPFFIVDHHSLLKQLL